MHDKNVYFSKQIIIKECMTKMFISQNKNIFFQVTDSHSVDVESLRRKSIESPGKSGKPTLSSQPNPVPLTQVY